jgi:hypothetical protein
MKIPGKPTLGNIKDYEWTTLSPAQTPKKDVHSGE